MALCRKGLGLPLAGNLGCKAKQGMASYTPLGSGACIPGPNLCSLIENGVVLPTTPCSRNESMLSMHEEFPHCG
jgi:hypothetical protein